MGNCEYLNVLRAAKIGIRGIWMNLNVLNAATDRLELIKWS
jgi:hypothetical protein